jgi:mRNA interferase MazF
MRPIHVVRLDKSRPAVVLTREIVRPHVKWWTVAPITSRVRGLFTEVAVGLANGLERDSVISCDNVATVPVADVGHLVGYLADDQERQLARAIMTAYDLEMPSLEAN